jgi:hypothetical protein
VIDALEEMLALQPVSFVYNNDATSRVRYGFIAEDATAVNEHLATYDASSSVSGIDDRAVVSIVASAIKEIAAITGIFKANLIAWLANAENGITDLFAKNLHPENVYAHRIEGDELWARDDAGEPVRVTGSQLRSLLNGSVLGAHAESESEQAADVPKEDHPKGAGGSPAPLGEDHADTATSTTPARIGEAADAPEQGGTEASAVPALGDEAQPSEATTSALDERPKPAEVSPQSTAPPDAANDNSPPPAAEAI